MPKILSASSLRNEYTRISKECHESDEPIFITVNGEGDLAVMSIDAFERREQMYYIRERLLEAQLEKARGVKPLSFDEAMADLEAIVHGN